MTAVDRPTDPKKDQKQDAQHAPADHAPPKPTLSDKVAAERSAPPAAAPKDASHTDASAERIKTALSELDSGKGRSQWAIEKDLRDTVRQHTRDQLSDIEKKLGGKLEDLVGENSHLSKETKEALSVYLHGSDHRSDGDCKKLMDSAVASKNLDLFREASGIASPEARAQFIKENGESRLHDAFSAERDYKQAHDLATMGQVGTLTKIWADKSGVWSKWSDEKGIEAALRNMPEEERKLYQNGAKLASGHKIDGLSNDDADRARKFYKDLNTEIESAANATQAIAWKAMAADGGAELLGKLAAQRGVLWNGGRSDLAGAIEGMSEQDWKYFNDPAHRRERRAAVEQTLSSVADKEDVGKLMQQFDRKCGAQDFNTSQTEGQRGILEALQDNTHWYRNDRGGVIDAITKMSPDEQKRYREDANFKKQVDDGVASVLKSGDSLVEAQRLLQKVHDGQEPAEDVLTKLRKNASTIVGDGAQSLRDIKESFDNDPKFRDSVLHPTADQKQFSQDFKELAARAVGDDPDKRALLDELLTKGSMSADKLVSLNNGYITNDYTRAMKDLAGLPEAERKALLAEQASLQRTIGFMDAARQKAAVEVLKSGKVGAEDQIYAAVSGTGHSGDVMEALRKLKPEELEQVRKEYERKYGGKLEDAVKDKLSGSELAEAGRILVSDKDARAKADEARDEYLSSRSGFGSWFSDTVLRSGTGLTADAAVNQQVKAVSEANQHQDEQHEAAIAQSQDKLRAAVDNHRESKDAIASGATDAAIGAVAIGTSIATFGGAVPLWVGVGGTLAIGAATKVGGGALFKGNDYDWTAANVIKDAGVGAINAGVSLIGPGQIAGVFGRKLLTEAAAPELTWAARTVAFARAEGYNTVAGGVGGTTGEAFNGLTQWDPTKSAAENWANVGTGSATGFLSGGIGAFALGNAFRIAGHAAGVFRPSMSSSIESAASHSTAHIGAAELPHVEVRAREGVAPLAAPPRLEAAVATGRQVLGNDGGVARPFEQLQKQAGLAHEQGDLSGARKNLQQMLDVYQREGGLTDAQVAQTSRRMAIIAYRSNNIPEAQRLVGQSIQSLEKQPLETQEMLKAMKLQRAIYEQQHQLGEAGKLDQRIALVNQRDQLLKSLPKNTPETDRGAAQVLILQAARDQSIKPQHLSLSEPINWAENMKPKLVTAHLQDRDIKVLVQHLDKNAPLDQNLAKQADLIVTCHPELLPAWAREKHLFPNHTGDVELTWRNDGRDITVVPTTPTLSAQALAQDPKFQYLRAAMLLEKKGAQLASTFDKEALVAQEYAKELRRAASESAERPNLSPRRFEPMGMTMVGRGDLPPQDLVKVNGKDLQAGHELSVGRNAPNDVEFPDSDTKVSRNHAVIGRTSDGRLYVRDDSSMNGTYIKRTTDGKSSWQKLVQGKNHYIEPADQIRLAEDGPILNMSQMSRLTPRDVARVNGRELKPNQQLSIGRLEDRDVQYSDADLSVSRKHAVVRRTDDGRLIINDESTYGTFVNGRRIPPKQDYELQPGDKVALGTNGTELNLDVMKVRPAPDAVRNKAAIDQSNEYAKDHSMVRPLEPGFQNGGARARFDANGVPSVKDRAITLYDPAKDTELRNAVARAHQLFDGLRSDPLTLMRKLNAYSNKLLTPSGMDGQAVNAWYDAFNHANAGKQVLLGEFIKEGKGVCSQQAFLLKVLADSFGLETRMVRGLMGRHAWVTMDIGPDKHIFDPRNIGLADGARFRPGDKRVGQYVTGFRPHPAGPFGPARSRTLMDIQPQRDLGDNSSEYFPLSRMDVSTSVHRADPRDLDGLATEAPVNNATTGEGSMKLGPGDKVPVASATYMSDNSLRTVKTMLGATDEEMGKGKVVLEVGSGAEQLVAQQAKAAGLEATFINMDPRMAWPLEKDLAETANIPRGGDIQAAIEARRRGRENPQPNTLAAASHQIPLQDGSVDTVLSHLSVPLYIRYDRDKISQTSNEFTRVLKVGGVARIHPVPVNTRAQIFHELDSLPVSYQYDPVKDTLVMRRLFAPQRPEVQASVLRGADSVGGRQKLIDLETQVYDYWHHGAARKAGSDVQPTALSLPDKGIVGYALVDPRARTVGDIVVKPGFGKHADALFDDVISQMRERGGTWNLKFGETSYWLQDYLQANRDKFDFHINSQEIRDGGPLEKTYRAQLTFNDQGSVKLGGSNDPVADLRRAVKEGTMQRTFDDHDAHVQVFADTDGKEHEVIVSLAGRQRINRELAIQELHSMSDFTTDFPTTVDLGDGRMAQTYMGQTLENKSTRGVLQLYNDPNNAAFRESFQEAMVERLIYGDPDTHLGNFTLNDFNGKMRVANIDVEQSFTHIDVPPPPQVEFLQGQELSVETLGKIQSFVRTLEKSRAQLKELHPSLTDDDINRMVSRARWFLEKQRFPVPVR
ncbi:MAG TPA: FHA domain-containing protein [Candidatus Obscuribacterales bacterium]